jgi:hypothetical protein
MADILDEIENDLRRDRLNRFWKRWGTLAVGAAIVVVAIFAGWRGYVAWQASRAATMGDRYLAAVRQSEAGQSDEAARAFEALAREGVGGYPALARFRLAAEQAGKGETAAAVAAFDALAADGSLPANFRDIARLRAGLLLVDSGSAADVVRRVEALTVPTNAYRHAARELMALAAYKAGDKPAAARWWRDLVTDREAPDGARNRGSLALAALAAEGVTPPGS